MWHRSPADTEIVSAGGIGMQYLYPWHGTVETPFGVARAVVAPGEVSQRHGHHEAESFFVLAGRGTLEVDGEARPVAAGDVVYLPPFSRHTLRNDGPATAASAGSGPGQPLVFLTIWWEDLALARRQAAAAAPSRPGGERVVVHSCPPTPNGDLHLGHLSGPYLAADLYTRYLRQRGIAAYHVCGTDDFQSYVAVKAKARGEHPAVTADHYAAEIQATLAAFDIHPDHFTRPLLDEGYVAAIQGFVRDLHERGQLVVRSADCLFCDACDRYLFEPWVAGRCPHCGEESSGNGCEQCGCPNDCSDLLDPVCTECGGQPSVRPLARLVLPLGRHAELIRDTLSRTQMSPHLACSVSQMLDRGLPDLAVSHLCEWGIPVPVEGLGGQVVWAWFEMAMGYRLGLCALAREQGWAIDAASGLPEPRPRVATFFGFDNAYYHCMLFRAAYALHEPKWDPLDVLVANELYKLDGAKFSTSRGHAVWGRDILTHVPADAVRFYLCLDRPETEQTDFSLAAFDRVVREELVETWIPWLRALGERVRRRLAGSAPEPGFWTAAQRDFFQLLGDVSRQTAGAFEAATFSPQRAARRLCELVREARRFAAAEAHWGANPAGRNEERTAVALELAAARLLASAVAPIMPRFACLLWGELGLAGTPEDAGWPEVPAWVPSGAAVSLGSGSFVDFERSIRPTAPSAVRGNGEPVQPAAAAAAR
jgi:methionyl-tRNA synthetase